MIGSWINEKKMYINKYCILRAWIDKLPQILLWIVYWNIEFLCVRADRFKLDAIDILHCAILMHLSWLLRTLNVIGRMLSYQKRKKKQKQYGRDSMANKKKYKQLTNDFFFGAVREMSCHSPSHSLHVYSFIRFDISYSYVTWTHNCFSNMVYLATSQPQ